MLNRVWTDDEHGIRSRIENLKVALLGARSRGAVKHPVN